jgi:SPOR domain
MADDQFQRSYRASEPPVRAPAKSTGTDPLAELARLIGQTDPFGEFGREAARRTAAPPSEERSDWNTQPLGTRYAPQAAPDPRAGVLSQRSAGNGYYTARSAPPEQLDAPQSEHAVQGYGRQTYRGTPPADEDVYPADHEARGYAPGQADYPQDAYDHDVAQQTDEEYYEDVPSSRRRLGVMAIAGVLALAVVGTAGAFGYRALFGSSGSPQPPPVIKADAGPNKIVPATAGKDTQANKLITERVNERGQSERLVSREEQPIDKPATVVLSQPQQQLPMGSGVVGSEPKKVRTIAIHPDQVADASAPGISPLAAAPRAAAAPAARASAPPARAATSTTADAEDDAAPAPAARSAVRQAAPASGNGPLSLNPDASAAARAPAAPARTAAVAPPAQPAQPAPAASSGTAGPGSYVQVSSQRSEAEAQSAFRSLQAKYPNQLGGRQLQILKADLGAKGTYYRAAVGPFGNANEAAELCSSLKSAGGQCLIQRN